jgi:hypothetical protein
MLKAALGILRKDPPMNPKMLLCLLSLSFAAFSQQDTITIIEKSDSAATEVVVPLAKSGDSEYSTEELKTKLAGYTRMHNAGHTLLAAGIPLTCVGILGLIGGFAIVANHQPAGLILVYIGEIGIGFGPEFWITGAVLNNIGGEKQREYERRLHVGVGLNGISFTYLF